MKFKQRPNPVNECSWCGTSGRYSDGRGGSRCRRGPGCDKERKNHKALMDLLKDAKGVKNGSEEEE